MQLTKLRKNNRAILEGEYFTFSTEHIFGILRYFSDEEYIIILLNCSQEEQEFRLSDRLIDYYFEYTNAFKKQTTKTYVIPPQGIKIIKSNEN